MSRERKVDASSLERERIKEEGTLKMVMKLTERFWMVERLNRLLIREEAEVYGEHGELGRRNEEQSEGRDEAREGTSSSPFFIHSTPHSASPISPTSSSFSPFSLDLPPIVLLEEEEV